MDVNNTVAQCYLVLFSVSSAQVTLHEILDQKVFKKIQLYITQMYYHQASHPVTLTFFHQCCKANLRT